MKWNLDEDRPIWIQLKEQLGKRIVAGQYQCGDRLPSVRELAKEASVNPNTMQRALASLDQDGLTVTHRTNGRCVTSNQETISAYRQEILKTIIQKYLAEMQEMGCSAKEALEMIRENST